MPSFGGLLMPSVLLFPIIGFTLLKQGGAPAAEPHRAPKTSLSR